MIQHERAVKFHTAAHALAVAAAAIAAAAAASPFAAASACSTAWRCRFLAARPSQHGRVIAEK